MKIRMRKVWLGADRSSNRRRMVVRSVSDDGDTARWPRRSVRPRNERGSAILVVLMLMFVIAAIIVANTQTLRHLKEEIRFVDQKQQQR